MRCANCGTENEPDALFCGHCGARLGDDSSSIGGVRQGRGARILPVLAAVLIPVVGACAFVFLRAPQVTQVEHDDPAVLESANETEQENRDEEGDHNSNDVVEQKDEADDEVIDQKDSSTDEVQTSETAMDVIQLDGCDFVVPDAWSGKVEQIDRSGDIILEWNETWMLGIRQCAPSEFMTDNIEVESYSLDNGTSVTIRSGSDFSYNAEIAYGNGRGLELYLFAYDENSFIFLEKSDETCREYLELQAAVAGCSSDDDSKEIAIDCLKACVNNLRFTEEGQEERDSDDPLVVSLGTWRVDLPEYWRDKVELRAAGAQGYGRSVRLPNTIFELVNVQETTESEYLNSMNALGTVTLKSGEEATVRWGDDGYVFFNVSIEGQRCLRVSTQHFGQVREFMGSKGPTSEELSQLADLQSLGRLGYTTIDNFDVPFSCLQTIASGTTIG